MDQYNQTNQGQPLQSAPIQPGTAPEHKKVGPIIAILIIILVLIIGALYLFASRINQEQDVDSTVASQETTSATTVDVKTVTNNSDDLKSIQDDLNSSTQGLENNNF